MTRKKQKTNKKQNPASPCPNCSSKNTVKFGKRKNKLETIQLYQCLSCNKRFTAQKAKNKTYPIKTILKAISYYNLGFSLNEQPSG